MPGMEETVISDFFLIFKSSNLFKILTPPFYIFLIFDKLNSQQLKSTWAYNILFVCKLNYNFYLQRINRV